MSAQGSPYHLSPFSLYLKVIITLFILTFLTVWVAQFDFGFMNTFVAMLIATIKATIVLAFFMHLKYDGKLYPAIVVTAVFFVFILYLFTEIDIVTRISESSTL